MSTNNFLFFQKDNSFVKQALNESVQSFQVRNGENLAITLLLFDGKLNLIVNLEDEFASCDIKVLYLAAKSDSIDIKITTNHIKSNTNSSQIVKGIATDKAKVNFHGKIYIAPDAQKSDGYQNHRALLLSNKTEIQSIPELEIYADDVKCAHGSATGPLEKDAVFYLMSRGISERNAKKILIHSFINDIIPVAYQPLCDDWIEQNV